MLSSPCRVYERGGGQLARKYLTLWEPELPSGLWPDGTHVHAFCQPGKHAFLPGGAVLVGGPFHGLYRSTPEEDARCAACIREKFAFEPTLTFDQGALAGEEQLRPWDALKNWISGRIAQLCAELI